MDRNTFFSLLDKYQDGSASAAEKALVGEYYRRLEAMGITNLSIEEEQMLRETMYQAIVAGIKEPVVRKMFDPIGKKRIVSTGRQVAAAAAIFIILATGSYFLFFNRPSGNSQEQLTTGNQPQDVKAPETNRAMITLANGERVYLDSVANGSLAQQSGVEIVKLADGKIVYKGTSTSLSVTYNTLTNQRGSTVIDMTLSDGSRVWLNAGSSVTYPIAFIGNERKVSITGEAYFEIAHDKAKPFIVSKGETSVTVLGTHFNVNAYDDEADIKVTLLEGSVKVSNHLQAVFIKPGEQARVSPNSPLRVGGVDLEQVMAWKNGWFEFDNTDLETIMRQVSRWYDLDIVYEGKISSEKFGGRLSKDLPLSSVLKLLEENGTKFRLNGKQLIVIP